MFLGGINMKKETMTFVLSFLALGALQHGLGGSITSEVGADAENTAMIRAWPI
jgi:hypothetical protein